MNIKLLGFATALFFASQSFAQQAFSLEESWTYALENNVQVKKAKIDMTIAEQKVKETIGIGLPQINAQGQYSYFLNLPVQLLPAKIFDPNAAEGEFFPVKFGQSQSMQGGLTLTQLLFNGSYIVGLQSSKAYKETAALAKEKTEVSIKEGILLSYTGILVMDENIATLAENQKILKKTLEDTRKTYEAGVIEFQNVEQLEYSYRNLATNVENLKRSREKLLMSLKYLMGFPLDESLTLTSDLDEVVGQYERLLAKDNFDISNHIDVRLRNNVVRLNELKLKLQKSKALPTLAAAVSTNYTGQSDEFTFFDKDQKWFNTSLVGLQLDVPIFSGLQRHWQTQQAKLDLLKAQLDKEDTEKNLKSELYSKSTDYENALASYQTAQELIKLSNEIYRKQNIKFKEGLGTSFELLQSENQLYEAQGKYYQSALELIQSAVRLDKAKGTL